MIWPASWACRRDVGEYLDIRISGFDFSFKSTCIRRVGSLCILMYSVIGKASAMKTSLQLVTVIIRPLIIFQTGNIAACSLLQKIRPSY